jgi:hypothetical protein
MSERARYEVQLRHPLWGWVSAGTWPARTKAEGLKSLDDCSMGVRRTGSIHAHRLVKLEAVVIAYRKAARRASRQEGR